MFAYVKEITEPALRGRPPATRQSSLKILTKTFGLIRTAELNQPQ